MVHTTTCLPVIVSSVSGRCKKLAVKAGTSIDPARLPCWPTSLSFGLVVCACYLQLNIVGVD